MIQSQRLLKLAAEIAQRCGTPIDRLPYTEQFSELHDEFVSLSGKRHAPHEFWWLMVSARKRGMIPARRRSKGD